MKSAIVKQWSDPREAQRKATDYLGPDAKLFFSTRKDKKYMVRDPDGRWSHFGQIGYPDFTLTGDIKRRQAYLKRANGIKGNWKSNKYSPNNLSIHILW